MSHDGQNAEPWIAFGVTFEIGDLRKFNAVFSGAGFDVAGEGTGASGYELCARQSHLTEVMIRFQETSELRNLNVQFYQNPGDRLIGTKYDRVTELFRGSNPG